MAIEKKLICFARLEEFERQLAAGNIKDYSIVLIQDAKKIYNRGTYYDCSGITQEEGDERYVQKITEDGMTVSGIDQIRNPSSGMTYAFSESGNGNENGIILTSDITKTINGTSLLGSGNIEIESSGEANVQSDWEQEDVGDDSYIKNRTHYCYVSTYVGQFAAESKEVGDVLFEGLYEGVQYTILNSRNTSKRYSFQFVTGRKINIPFNGPTVEAVCSEDGSLVLASSAYGIAEHFYVYFAEVKQLDDIYIPETIARTSELKTINGESIVGSGDLTIEGGAKIYTWSPTITSIEDEGTQISGTFTEEEYYNILNADVLYINVDGESIFCIARGVNSENGEGIRITVSQITTYADFAIDIFLIKEDGVFTGTMSEPIPSKTSQLENDSNFITSDGLKTINGESIVGSGNIEISGGVSQDYVDNAIANAITTTLNTAV